MGLRSAAAVAAVRGVNAASRLTGRGSGTVAGGRAGLAVDPSLLSTLSVGRRTALVTGTNGKTTTTALLAAALRSTGEQVASNATGSNMPAGHVAALVSQRHAPLACLEVDEAYVGQVVEAVRPEVVILLNLSRDQLDRMSEVRMVAERWRRALEGPAVAVVANADDPLVAFGASSAERVTWVSGGLAWDLDAGACPWCRGAIAFDEDGWACSGCGQARPEPSLSLEGSQVVGVDGHLELDLKLPGAFNRANALMALGAARAMGVEAAEALEALGEVEGVAGRFTTRTFAGTEARLMLAKNPAGWAALLDLVAGEDRPVVVSINARTADGADPSWLFDVDFSRLAGRRVIATGDRCRDLAVRLTYAGVDHQMVEGPLAAVAAAGSTGDPVEVIGNYTAFRELLEAS